MRITEIHRDELLESYLTRWDLEVTRPLLEWARTINEANLNQAQIDALFNDVEQSMSSEKTGVGKAASAAGKVVKAVVPVLPPALASKLHELIKDTKPVKAFDDAFENKKTQILAKHPKLEKVVTALGDKAKKHPIAGAAVIGILTTAAALMTGGVGGFAVGAVLKTGNDLLKGETLSKSLAGGVGAGLLGALASMPIRELGDVLTNFEINSSTVPGYESIVKVRSVLTQTGMSNVYIDTYMTRVDYDRYVKLQELASEAFSAGNYDRSAEIYQKLGKIFNNSDYIDAMSKAAENNKELVAQAVEGSKKAAKVFDTLAAAVQGAATGAGSKKLEEADLKAIAGSIANWAKNKAAESGKEMTQTITVKKLMAAWDKAGRPTESDAIHHMLASAGVPENVLQQSFKGNKIPLPKGPSKPRTPKAKPIEVNTGDAAFDKQINDIIATQGKDAAVRYLTDLKTKMQAPAAQTKHGDVRKASDGQEYRLDIGSSGDRIWFNVKTGNEASDAIDKELEGTQQQTPRRTAARRRRPAATNQKTASSVNQSSPTNQQAP